MELSEEVILELRKLVMETKKCEVAAYRALLDFAWASDAQKNYLGKLDERLYGFLTTEDIMAEEEKKKILPT